MGTVKPYCPTCGETVEKANAVEPARTMSSPSGGRRRPRRWLIPSGGRQALQDVLHRRRDRDDEDDRSFTSWEEDRLREALDDFRHAQEVFKAARAEARV